MKCCGYYLWAFTYVKWCLSGTVFTTVHFLHNLWMSQIRWSVNQTKLERLILWLIRPFWMKWILDSFEFQKFQTHIMKVMAKYEKSISQLPRCNCEELYSPPLGNCNNFYFTIEFENRMWVRIVWLFESDWIPNHHLSNKSNSNTDKPKEFRIRSNIYEYLLFHPTPTSFTIVGSILWWAVFVRIF